MTIPSAARPPNRLARETSPYLLQHAHNPVDWYPWGSEALERARSEDRPILLSIGYAACHWCHVMERESFEDAATAAVMNEHFVCIKVDREERPDLDAIYMSATVAMSGSGGWPMTVFLTPERKPFFAGTYFPPDSRYGRPGFRSLLERIGALWRSDRRMLENQAEELVRVVAEEARASSPAPVLAASLDEAEEHFARAHDPVWGGFGRAPKFPPAQSLRLLLRQHRRTGSERALHMVVATLDGMMNGGIRDHLGGGFHRYSTDAEWLVPHFEKMLYDNALLAVAYAEAFQVTGRDAYEQVAREILDYVLREMTSPEGLFHSATDADSEGVEGRYFVWTPDDLEAALPAEQARAFAAAHDVTAGGNWEGHSILRTLRSRSDVAGDLGVTTTELERLLSAARETLLRVRAERVPPLLDDKVLTAWNALMISAFAECGRILGDVRYIDAASRGADALLATMTRPDGGLFRTSRAGKTHLEAYLEDYAYLCDALVDAYEASGAPRHIEVARRIGERMLADFRDPETGAFFQTAHGHEALIVRSREGQDGAIPAANAVAARALLRLAWHFGRAEFREHAEGAIRAHGRLVARAPRAFATSLLVLDMLLEGPTELVFAEPTGQGEPSELRRELGRVFLPNRQIVHVSAGQPSHAPESLVSGKQPVHGQPTLYVCRDFTCGAPVVTPSEVRAAVARTPALESN